MQGGEFLNKDCAPYGVVHGQGCSEAQHPKFNRPEDVLLNFVRNLFFERVQSIMALFRSCYEDFSHSLQRTPGQCLKISHDASNNDLVSHSAFF